jgi:hypothetical protein
MKKNIMIITVTILVTGIAVQQASAIGISPARMTYDVREYNCTFNSNIGYTLTRPGSARYSMFSVCDVAGMSGTVTGCGASGSVTYIDSKNILIDWQSTELSSKTQTTATINIQSPQSWDCPAIPGEGPYMVDFVWHSDVVSIGSGISVGAATISQISLWRNYALRGTVTGVQNEYNANQAVQFGVDVVDYYIGNGMLKWFDFSYTIDWESDGVIDGLISGVRMADELGQTGANTLCAGFKYKTLGLEHIYSEPGDYIISISLKDSIDTTSLQIPVHIIPEPMSLLLLGIGGIFARRLKH